MDIVELYVMIDDFCKKFNPKYQKLLIKKKIILRHRQKILNNSEIILIILLFPTSEYKCFKWFYINKIVKGEYREYFKNIPSYNRFIEYMPMGMLILSRLLGYIMYCNRRKTKNIYFIDSTRIPICHNKRTNSHKTFASIAKIGKSTMGWFMGFKLHTVIDTLGNLISVNITSGNIDDRVPLLKLVKGITGKLFGDKGYIKKDLFKQLQEVGLMLITPLKKNMKSTLPIDMLDIIMSKKRVLIESVFNILKNKLQLCHTRHRSINNFCVHILAVLTCYSCLKNKPKLS